MCATAWLVWSVRHFVANVECGVWSGVGDKKKSIELLFVVGMTRFELATSGPPDRCATGLRHIPSSESPHHASVSGTQYGALFLKERAKVQHFFGLSKFFSKKMQN